MTSPVSQDDSAVSPTTPESQLSTKFVRAGIGLTKFARSPSSGSLNNVFSIINDPSGAEQNFRLCVHCKDLLDARERLKARHFMKPVMTRYYDEMRNSMEEATRFMTMYNKMWESIRLESNDLLFIYLIIHSFILFNLIYFIYSFN